MECMGAHAVHMHMHMHMQCTSAHAMCVQLTDDKRLEDAPRHCCGGALPVPVCALEKHELAPSQARDLVRLG